MTKDEYNSELKGLTDLIASLKHRYIEANKVRSIGDNVKIVRHNNVTDFGLVKDVFVSDYGDIHYEYTKLKKDGTPSANAMYAWSSDKLTDIKE